MILSWYKFCVVNLWFGIRLIGWRQSKLNRKSKIADVSTLFEFFFKAKIKYILGEAKNKATLQHYKSDKKWLRNWITIQLKWWVSLIIKTVVIHIVKIYGRTIQEKNVEMLILDIKAINRRSSTADKTLLSSERPKHNVAGRRRDICTEGDETLCMYYYATIPNWKWQKLISETCLSPQRQWTWFENFNSLFFGKGAQEFQGRRLYALKE